MVVVRERGWPVGAPSDRCKDSRLKPIVSFLTVVHVYKSLVIISGPNSEFAYMRLAIE